LKVFRFLKPKKNL